MMGFVLLLVMLMPVPYFIGMLTADAGRKRNSIGITWVSGYVILWALFLLLSVPVILMEGELSAVVTAFIVGTIILVILGIIFFIRTMKSREAAQRIPLTRTEIIYLGIAGGIILFQLYRTFAYAYADGDDAYYVAIARTAEESGRMYLHSVYTGTATTLNFRYCLAPFPIWIATLARMSGISSATVSHSILPMVLIPMTYILYNEIAKFLFKGQREKRYLFMIFMSVIQLFGNYSISTAETFLLTRSRQGKTALANIVIPFMLLIMLELADKTVKIMTLDIKTMILLLTISATAGLCSLFGNILFGIMIFALLVLAFIRKSTIKTKLGLMLTTLPSIVILVIFVLN